MINKIVKSVSVLFFIFCVSFLSTSALTKASELNQAYQNCLCKCGCTEANWNCAAVSCTFNTSDYTGSPSCEDAAAGPCKCEGFGCGRAPIVTSGACYDSCQQHLTAATCDALNSDYSAARQDYIDKLNSYQELTSFEYKVISTLHKNTMKLGMAFLINHMGQFSTSFSDVAQGIVETAVNNNLYGSEDDATKIQVSVMGLYRELEDKRELLRAEQHTKMRELQSLLNSMDQAKCVYEAGEPLAVVSDDSLSDVGDLTPRDLKIVALSDFGVIGGYPDGTYQSDKKINRAEFIKILIATKYPDEVGEDADSDESKQSCFDDVVDDWYAKYVCVAKEKGIVNGYADGTFGPGNDINSAEALKIIMETFHPDSVKDVEGDWWQKYWDSAEGVDVVLDDIDSSDDLINRGQMAEMIYNALSEDIASDAYKAEEELVYYDMDEFVELDLGGCDVGSDDSSSSNNSDSTSDGDSSSSSSDDSSSDSDASDSTEPVGDDLDAVEASYPNSFSKDGEYTYSYPDGWDFVKNNETHQTFTKGTTEISITESGYTYDRIKELIMETYMALPDAELIESQDIYSEEIGSDIYMLVVSYDVDGVLYIGEKIVVPNLKDTHYIWEMNSTYDEFEDNSDLFASILGTWEVIE